ncbi:hypothetical protein B0J12DRAFT_425609 [Macrophomina phaseolina]|uniref:Uncharacterized protein n=1 Tax=Macrophomina phaseolina TaxID=35725 RepID=A0ABQ8GJN0_9PEZI|nr:hypothetical protein B0J12DRAFT_425609 [Macrophomina phaseolina]
MNLCRWPGMLCYAGLFVFFFFSFLYFLRTGGCFFFYCFCLTFQVLSRFNRQKFFCWRTLAWCLLSAGRFPFAVIVAFLNFGLPFYLGLFPWFCALSFVCAGSFQSAGHSPLCLGRLY